MRTRADTAVKAAESGTDAHNRRSARTELKIRLSRACLCKGGGERCRCAQQAQCPHGSVL
ncbi:MAG: hypothetical protein HFE36_06850 [Clostridia bacterium]|nr:hypothetical protein [Clostridia bacterium]